ncbi:S1 family peptidase [Streptomyces sp. SID10815]|uniref:S1 family peptidase n=1 Tax=Streptomyces sp. SID10815 TaxID=2706027 RepID=UPI0019455386|nr:S1 family peptidase [Streptomyces sp. SID10815]
MVATAAGTLLSAAVATGATAQAAPSPTAPRYQPAMVAALAHSLGVSETAAVARLDHQAAQQAELGELNHAGVATDGAYFTTDGKLTVNVSSAAAAAQVRQHGLTARVPQRGEHALNRIKASLDTQALHNAPEGVASWSVDLPSDTVTVHVDPSRTSAAAKSFLKAAASHGSAVRVVRDGQSLGPQSTIYPGSPMTWTNNKGSWVCSVGYGAHDSSGRQYLVSAGHCVADLTDLYNNKAHFAKGVASRYKLGTRSVDMGLAQVDSDDSIATQVGTWGTGANIAVKGSKRAASGASLCKSGQTTGWTCGAVKSYNVSVTYIDEHGGPDTVVTGLGSSSVCTEGGDSGGAYISGNQAQGMTSGGPTDQQCSGGTNSRGSSYFQPLDDALSYYGLTLNTN